MSQVDITAPRRIGRYELSTKIASGGMASVYFGRTVGSEGFSRVVAIKRMHPHLAEDVAFRAMFVDEARLAAQIHHPNVVQILDLVAEGDELLLVMNYVHGATVSNLLHAGDEPLRADIAVRIAIDVLAGLHAAHTAKGASGEPLGIVHRDVSPQNLLVSVDGVTLVADFGVAKAAVRLQTTREGELKGKLRYMPPEQLRQAPPGPSTDVYGLAAVLWEMLTSSRMFTAASEAALVAQILDGQVASPSSVMPGVPAALDEIVMRGLDRDVARRYSSALAMAEALEATNLGARARDVAVVVSERAHAMLETREVTLSRVRATPPDEPSEASTLPTPSEYHDATVTVEPRAASRRARTLLLAVLGVAVSGAAAFALASRTTSAPAPVVAASQDLPAPPGVPSPEAAASTEAPAPIATAPITPSPRPLAPVTAPRPVRSNRAPSDCAKNPRVLGPDGVYQVRRECLGR